MREVLRDEYNEKEYIEKIILIRNMLNNNDFITQYLKSSHFVEQYDDMTIALNNIIFSLLTDDFYGNLFIVRSDKYLMFNYATGIKCNSDSLEEITEEVCIIKNNLKEIYFLTIHNKYAFEDRFYNIDLDDGRKDFITFVKRDYFIDTYFIENDKVAESHKNIKDQEIIFAINKLKFDYYCNDDNDNLYSNVKRLKVKVGER